MSAPTKDTWPAAARTGLGRSRSTSGRDPSGLISLLQGYLVSWVKNFRVSHQIFNKISEGMFGY
jgi:hypothetical protein